MQNLTQKLTLLTLILLAFSLCAAAQTTSTVTGVTLSGPLAHPRIENHSGKPVLWISWKRSIAQDADPREGGQWFIDQAGGLPDGASAELGRYSNKANVVTSAAITAAIFADGEFRGKAPGPIGHDVEITFQLMKEAWRLAQAKEWDKLQVMADKVDDGILPQMAARKLLQARGNDAAMAALAHYGSFPASTWQAGPLINRIPFLQLLAQWFSPMVAHAQCILPTTCPPWSSGTVIQYPQSGTWVYNCVDYVIGQSPNPCPALGGNSTVGATAVWVSAPGEVEDGVLSGRMIPEGRL